MNLVKSYSRSPNLLAEKLDDSLVMLNIERGNYYALNGVAPKVWEAIETPKTLADITAAICSEFEVDEETCRRDMEQFLETLESIGLVQVEER